MDLRSFYWLAVVLCSGLSTAPLAAQCGGTGGVGPDVIVGDVGGYAPDPTTSYGNAGGFYAYAVSTTSCNIGTTNLQWVQATTEHPVIGQNLFRLRGGRFEHIGQSWLKHGFAALQDHTCCTCPNPGGTLQFLQPGCSDPYNADLNGSQGGLTPKSEVGNPAAGVFLFPSSLDPPITDLTWRRIRVPAADLDPAQNPGALYFAEGQYVTPDDAASGNAHNNCSYRQVSFGTNPANYPISMLGTTQRQLPGIRAWRDTDPSVTLTNLIDSTNGLLILGHKVTDNGNGTHHYEYAVQNLNSTRAAKSFSIPVPPGVTITGIGFHAPLHHSGEIYDNTVWSAAHAGIAVTWQVAAGSNNALRWGTLYNFRFDANAPPMSGTATLEHLVPGAPSVLTALTQVPSGSFTPIVQNLTCQFAGQSAVLSWTNGSPSYSSLEVTRDGVPIATLGGAVTGYTDPAPPPGLRAYGVNAFLPAGPSGPASCNVQVQPPFTFSYPGGLPVLIDRSGDSFAVQIIPVSMTLPQAGTERLFYDDGSGYQSTPLVSLGGLSYSAVFPANLDCGAIVSFYLRAVSTGGVEMRDPPEAPATDYLATAALSVTNLLHDMEDALGWTVGATGDDATTGIWERVDPVGTAAQPEDDHTPGAGTECWVTGQGLAGGQLGTADVDFGQTTLVSPPIDLADGNDPHISYWRWFSNDEGSAPSTDIFEVEVSNNGTTWVDVETVGPASVEASGGWFFHEFRVLDLVALSASVRVRFRASDEDPGSIVEAAIDDFTISDVECAPPGGVTWVRGDCNGDAGLDVSDPVALLDQLFGGAPASACPDACDANDDGATDIADVILELNYIFAGSSAPAAPFPSCGTDGTADALGCASFAGCP